MNLHMRVSVGSLRDIKLQLRYESVRALPLRWRGLTATILLAAWAALALVDPTPIPSPFGPWIGPVHAAPELPRPWPLSVALEADDMVDGRFGRGSTMAGELGSHGIPAPVVSELVDASRDTIDPRRIRDGQQYRLYFGDDGGLLAVRYQIDRQTAYFVAREEDGWRTTRVVIPVQIRPRFLSARIGTTLEASLALQARDRRSTYDLVSDIADVYGWDVDFNYDLQRGDRIDLVVEERWVEGEFIGYGDILAAEFRVGGRNLPVVRYRDPDGNVSFFTPQGESLRRTFLRSPVKYQRISSRFSGRRIHPVTGVARAHRGVDYVANPGTPVQATADGVVDAAAWGGERGRYVKIRHGGSYASYYLHLSGYAEGIETGVTVEQGDVVGYVGKTGNATGYHLHYSLLQGDRYVDPLEVQFPAAEPIPSADWERFVEQRSEWLGILRAGQSQISIGQQVAGGAGGA